MRNIASFCEYEAGTLEMEKGCDSCGSDGIAGEEMKLGIKCQRVDVLC